MRANHFNHLFERQILVCLCSQGLLFDLLHQRFDARRAREVDPYSKGVDEEPDQALHLGIHAVGHRRTDHHVILTGQTCQQRRPCGHDRHEQAAAMALAQRLETMGQVCVEHQFQRLPAVVLLRRTWPVGRQGQQGWRTGQCLLPVLTLLLQYVATQPVTLPQRVVGVLHWQGRQWVLGALVEGFIESAQLAVQNPG